IRIRKSMRNIKRQQIGTVVNENNCYYSFLSSSCAALCLYACSCRFVFLDRLVLCKPLFARRRYACADFRMSSRDDLLEQAYLKLRLPLFRFLKRKLGNEADAEDVTQESFARWSASSNTQAPDNTKAYLTQIAINIVRETGNKQSRSPAMVSLDDETQDNEAPSEFSTSNPEQRTEHLQCLGRIEQALQELPALQREAFSLHRFDHLTYEQIALKLNISRALVSRYISRTVAYCRLRVDYSAEQALSMLSSKENDDEK
ncbi:TPA: sigma-70 family RNA polymerase sigma factor, partial [Klebsiella pneumoniae]|nr:sigma-70 family RNA polymerase sigma factor [Klebsiella pneumoniae]